MSRRILLLWLVSLSGVAKADWKQDVRLLSALQAANVSTAAESLAAGADPDTTDVTGCTPIYWASAQGLASVVEELVRRRADINQTCELGSPLWAAVSNGHASVVVHLLSAGAQIRESPAEVRARLTQLADRGRRETAVLIAGAYGPSQAVLRAAVNGEPIPVSVPNAYPDLLRHEGRTALMWASSRGDLPAVQALLSRRASVDAIANDGENPLSLATRSKQIAAVKVLIAARPSPRTALRAKTAAAGNPELESLLEPLVRAGDRALALAAAGNEANALRAARLNGTLDWLDPRERTPLQAAAAAGQLKVVEAFVMAGANLTLGPNQQAVRLAEAANQKDVVAYLRPRVEIANNRQPLASILPALSSYEELWRLRPGWRAVLIALDSELRTRLQRPSLVEQPSATRALTAVTGLRAQAEKFWRPENPVPRPYVSRLTADLWAVHTAGSGERALKVLTATAEDLEDKLRFCRASSTGLGGSITLQVRTLKGSDEIRNLRVYYLPKIFETRPDGEPFPVLSSPTDLPLSPGHYLVWAQDPASGKSGQRTAVRLGARPNEVLQIFAP